MRRTCQIEEEFDALALSALSCMFWLLLKHRGQIGSAEAIDPSFGAIPIAQPTACVKQFDSLIVHAGQVLEVVGSPQKAHAHLAAEDVLEEVLFAST